MTLVYLKGRRIEAQSTDTKPVATELPPGWKLYELDTGRVFLWDGTQWIFIDRTKEAENKNALQPRSSLTNLFGDTFAKTSASMVTNLEDLTDKQGGTSWANPNAATFEKAEEFEWRGFDVLTLDGVNQYLSMGTETKNEVGTGDVTVKTEFKTSLLDGSLNVLFMYGSLEASHASWRAQINNDAIFANVIDASGNTANITSTEIGRYQDDEIHKLVFKWNATSGKLTILIDGEIIGTSTNASVGSLTEATESLYIGARKNSSGVMEGFFTGQQSNFQLYLGDDDALLPLLSDSQLRESASGETGTPVHNVEANSRMNNRFYPSNINGNYFSKVINTSEGIYDLSQFYFSGTNEGISVIEIDGVERLRVDMYAASSTFNLEAKATPFFLGAGSHILKWKNDDKNASSSAFIMPTNRFMLKKSGGKDQGNDEATSILEFGDGLTTEIGTWTTGVDSAMPYNNGVTNSTVGNQKKGKYFLKKGMYDLTVGVNDDTTNYADVGVYIGGVYTHFDFGTVTTFNIQTKSVFVEGGELEIMIENETGSGTNALDFTFLKLDIKAGKGNGDEVTIWGSDDLEVIQGTWGITIDTAERFNFFKTNSTNTDGDHLVVRPYLSGGTYKAEMMVFENTDSGLVDVYSNSNSASPDIFNQVDFASSVTRNLLHNEIVTLPRGFQEIHYVVNGSNNLNFQARFTYLKFTKIATVLNAENDDNSDPVHGDSVILGAYTAQKSEASHTMNFGGVNFSKYEEIEVHCIGEADGALALETEWNGLTSNYQVMGAEHDSGTENIINLAGQTEVQLISSNLIDINNRMFECEFSLSGDVEPTTGSVSSGRSQGGAVGEGGNILSIGQSATPITGITQLIIQTSANNWKKGMKITVRGKIRQ